MEESMKKIIICQLKTKGELLEHYSKKEPNLFLQLDGDSSGEKIKDGEVIGQSGIAISARDTYELMSSCPDVRVLINPNTRKEDIEKILTTIIDYINKHYEILDPNLEKKKQEKLSKLLRDNNFSESFVRFWIDEKDKEQLL